MVDIMSITGGIFGGVLVGLVLMILAVYNSRSRRRRFESYLEDIRLGNQENLEEASSLARYKGRWLDELISAKSEGNLKKGKYPDEEQSM